jgi:hypothetical protein
LRAQEWAEDVLKAHPFVRAQDRPYLLEVLTEVAAFEHPVKELACGINDTGGDQLNVTVKGYRKLISDRLWASIFLSRERSEMMQNVDDTFTQLTDEGAIKVIYVKKVRFNNGRTVTKTEHAGSSRRVRK